MQQLFNAHNQISGSPYSYDAAGNYVGDGSHTYQYDAEGKVLKVDNGSTAIYVYDAMNYGASVATASGTNEFTYDDAGRFISTWIASSNFGSEGRLYWDDRSLVAGGTVFAKFGYDHMKNENE